MTPASGSPKVMPRNGSRAPTAAKPGRTGNHMTDRHTLSNGQGQGMNWIRPDKRLAIYLRDGLACAWCGASVEDGTRLTLDHLTPHADGGTNQSSNLVTACHRCNSSRGRRTPRAFVSAVAAYLNHGVKAADILAHVRTTSRRPLDLAAARALIAKRGGFTAALKG